MSINLFILMILPFYDSTPRTKRLCANENPPSRLLQYKSTEVDPERLNVVDIHGLAHVRGGHYPRGNVISRTILGTSTGSTCKISILLFFQDKLP
jgi:hypothetical protein